MHGKLQFGIFEVDQVAMELRKHGVPVRLQDQPLRVLLMLVERPGEIVTREDLRERIWGKDTFVDFEQSLNKAVNRLREALNDDASQPRYVETVPRRGYRFIAPVAGLIAAETPPLVPNLESRAEPASFHRLRPAKSRTAIFATAVIVAVVALVAAILTIFWRKPQKFTPPEAKLITSAAWCCPRLSRDGKLLAYVSEAAGGRLHIWIQQTAGGEAIPVTRDSDVDIGEDFSPDGTQIAFVSQGAIRIAPTLSGEARLLAPTDGGYPVFSPDGQKILYWQTTGAMIVSVASGERVTPDFNRDYLVFGPPLWSPNGDSVLFYGVSRREPEKPNSYWIASLNKGDTRPLDLPTGEIADRGRVIVRAWLQGKDGADWILFSVQSAAGWRLYRNHISPQGHIHIDDKPELLTSGTDFLGYSVSVSEEGKLVYLTGNVTQSLYEIPNNSQDQKTGPVAQLPLSEGGDYRSPSLSWDGKWMAYDASATGKTNEIRLRDLESGADRLVDEKGRHPGSGGEVILSPDGSKIAFERLCGNGKWSDDGNPLPCVYVNATAGGGEAEKVCDFCTPRGFSSNGSTLLVQNYHKDGKWPHTIDIIDLKSRTQKEFLSTPGASVYHAFFSPDDHWVVFKKRPSPDSENTPIMIAPVRDGVAGKEAEWIAVTDGQHADDKPQFAADGNTVYFNSTRDGYLCIWAQRLNPVTKHPLGEPTVYEHFHNGNQRTSRMYWAKEEADLSVAKDKMVITLPQYRGQVWMTQIE